MKHKMCNDKDILREGYGVLQHTPKDKDLGSQGGEQIRLFLLYKGTIRVWWEANQISSPWCPCSCQEEANGISLHFIELSIRMEQQDNHRHPVIFAIFLQWQRMPLRSSYGKQFHFSRLKNGERSSRGLFLPCHLRDLQTSSLLSLQTLTSGLTADLNISISEL